MFESPKSLTATIYVRFHYKEPEPKVEEGEVQLVDTILNRASDMSPEFREILLKFVEYLSHLGKDNEQSPT